MKKWLVIGVVLIIATAVWAQYQTKNYMKDGGDEWVVGGALTVSGTLSLPQSGTLSIGGNATSAKDFVMAEATITSATIATQIIGNSLTLDDGSGDSPSLNFKDGTDETAVFKKLDSGYLTITTLAADGVNILTGNLKVGNGTPGQTINGEDVYIEGLLEVDGVIHADGGVVGAHNGTVGATTPQAGTFTTITANTSLKVSSNGSSIGQINCGTFKIDDDTTSTVVSLTGCTEATRIIIQPTTIPAKAKIWYATPGTDSFIGKVNEDPNEDLNFVYIAIK